MGNPVSQFVSQNFYWVFIAILVVNLLQRKYRRAAFKKRNATLYLAIAVFLFSVCAVGIVSLKISDYYLLIYAGIAIPVFIVFRKTLLPFTLRCRDCRETLDFNRVLYADSNLCANCERKLAEPAEDAAHGA